MSEKMPYAIYADIEYLVKKIDSCENNPQISSSSKTGKHIPCGYLVSTIWGSDHIENKHSLYHGKACMKELCKFLKDNAKKIINFKKTKMLSLTPQELKSY